MKIKVTKKQEKILVYSGVFIVVVMLGVFVADYFALFKSNDFESGPVILDSEEALTMPEEVSYTIEPVVGDLVIPWSIVFTSEDRWLVSERTGSIRVIEDEQLIEKPLITFPEVTSNDEEGLMGLELDPNYDKNKLVYACLAKPLDGSFEVEVVRFKDNGSSASTLEVVVDDIPGAKFHAGCRLAFGPDDKLYISTGDATDRNIAQDIDSLGGKILRVNPDGSIPEDNPFEGSKVWSLGHRNPQGLAFQPETGSLFETEHGPSLFDGPAGGDEINIIIKGENYGWPEISHDERDPRFVDPLLVFTPAVAPAGAAFYTGDDIPQFKNNFFFTGLKGQGVFRVVLSENDPSKVVMYEQLPIDNVGRIRDVADGPDGALYFLTSNRDGRGDVRDGDDKIYRIIPE